jgi:hypothetical protein
VSDPWLCLLAVILGWRLYVSDAPLVIKLLGFILWAIALAAL